MFERSFSFLFFVHHELNGITIENVNNLYIYVHFRLLILFREEEKFDCITVSYAPIKSYIDYLLSELNSSLIRVMQRTISQDASRIQAFIQESTSTLLRRPQSVDEMTESIIKLEEIKQLKSEVRFHPFLLSFFCS